MSAFSSVCFNANPETCLLYEVGSLLYFTLGTYGRDLVRRVVCGYVRIRTGTTFSDLHLNHAFGQCTTL